MTGTSSRVQLYEVKNAEGRVVRAYRVLAEIGDGAFSTVVLAERRRGDTDESEVDHRLARVALKVATGSKQIALLRKEAETLRAIRDTTDGRPSRVVRLAGDGLVHEVADAMPARAILELEYLDGDELGAWMKTTWFDGSVPTRENILHALRIALELARALDELASVGEGGLIHRDLKPENVKLTGTSIRLFDFNVAREVGGDETLTRRVGTPRYMAPEVRRGETYDARADVFSLGVILTELLTREPFGGLSDAAVGCEFPRPELLDAVAEPQRSEIQRLVEAMLEDQERRVPSAEALARRLDEIVIALTATGDDPLGRHDLIQLLFELRPDGLLAVVADSPAVAPVQQNLRRRLQVDDPLEDWLLTRVRAAAEHGRPTLVVFAGNAGDGKSHLIDRLVHRRLAGEPALAARVQYIADATHADRPTQSQAERLERFFAPLVDEAVEAGERPVRLIAMNTGMVLRFFDEMAARGSRFDALATAMRIQLGLARGAVPELGFELLVVNLDLRDPLAPGPDGTSFFERMLDRLDPSVSGSLLADRWRDCEACPARQVCSVHYNLEALRRTAVRHALSGVLSRAALDPEVHLSPRVLWGFLYRLLTGGKARYALHAEEGSPCDVVRRRREDHEWLLAQHFSEIPFAADDLPDIPLFSTLARLDPALSPAPALDRLQTRFAIQSYRDDSEDEIAVLGGSGKELAGLAIAHILAAGDDVVPERRRDAALRRRVFFDSESYRAYAAWGAAERFERLLAAYQAYSRGLNQLDAESQSRLRSLSEMVTEVFLKGAGTTLGRRKFLRVSQPNAEVDTHLLVEVDDAVLRKLFRVSEMLVPDLHVRTAPEGLLAILGYRPKVLVLRVAGRRLVVDLDLYEFLEQVVNGRQPSRRDLAQFEALVFIGEHLGNAVAAERKVDGGALFVLSGKETLHRLAIDEFGATHLTTEKI